MAYPIGLVAKRTTDDYLNLNVNTLNRLGYLTAGTVGDIHHLRGGRRIGTTSIEVWHDRVSLIARPQGSYANVPIYREVAGGTDGLREWWRCPKCDRQCEILYLVPIGWACRICGDLIHACQRESGTKRALGRAERIVAGLSKARKRKVAAAPLPTQLRGEED